LKGTEAVARLQALARAITLGSRGDFTVTVRVVAPPRRQPSRAVLRSREYRARGGGKLRDVPFPPGAVCSYCAVALDLVNRRAANGATWDHVLPLSKGGTNEPENIVAACFRCNSTKRDRTPEQAGMVLR
jgi:5-methylcytosine-specific restriction endonuclease McrA